jgi:hypothetical protein
MHEKASTHPVFTKEKEEEEEEKKKKDDEMVARHADKIINKLVYKPYMETNSLNISAKFPSYFSV